MFNDEKIPYLSNEELVDFVLSVFLEANKMMLIRDSEEIQRDVSERTLCANLKEMINKIMEHYGSKDYIADVEYNRYGKKIKSIHVNNKHKPIQCDLILHSRGKNDLDNLLCLEMKKAENKEKIRDDFRRLRKLTSCDFEWENEKYHSVSGFVLGVFYRYDKETNNCNLIFFKYGELKKAFNYKFSDLMGELGTIKERILKNL